MVQLVVVIAETAVVALLHPHHHVVEGVQVVHVVVVDPVLDARQDLSHMLVPLVVFVRFLLRPEIAERHTVQQHGLFHFVLFRRFFLARLVTDLDLQFGLHPGGRIQRSSCGADLQGPRAVFIYLVCGEGAYLQGVGNILVHRIRRADLRVFRILQLQHRDAAQRQLLFADRFRIYGHPLDDLLLLIVAQQQNLSLRDAGLHVLRQQSF